MKRNARYFTYIITDAAHMQLDTGITGDLALRAYQLKYGLHDDNRKKECRFLVYYESFPDVQTAIAREKDIARMSFRKKKALIEEKNPMWQFYNEEMIGQR